MKKLWILQGMVAALAIAPAIPQAVQAAESAETACGDGVIFRLGSAVAEIGTGKSVSLPAAPFIQGGRMMAPLFAFAEGLNAEITWHEKTKEITIVSGDHTVLLKVGSADAVEDGRSVALTAPVTLIGNRAFAPLKPIADAIGAATNWDARAKAATFSRTGCGEAIRLGYSFGNGADGWTGGFADLPVDYADNDYRLEHKWSEIPLTGTAKAHGLLLHGMNRSDDLFMYVSKELGTQDGLGADADYRVKLRFDLATDVSGGLIGAGGSPGEAVTVKAGVVSREPRPVRTSSGGTEYYRMNIDIGAQVGGGSDLKALGNVVKPDDSQEGYQLKPFEAEFTAKADAEGHLWIVLGTDSGFEGLTRVYFTNVNVTFEKAE